MIWAYIQIRSDELETALFKMMHQNYETIELRLMRGEGSKPTWTAHPLMEMLLL